MAVAGATLRVTVTQYRRRRPRTNLCMPGLQPPSIWNGVPGSDFKSRCRHYKLMLTSASLTIPIIPPACQ